MSHCCQYSATLGTPANALVTDEGTCAACREFIAADMKRVAYEAAHWREIGEAELYTEGKRSIEQEAFSLGGDTTRNVVGMLTADQVRILRPK